MMQALASMPHSTTAVESLLSYGLRTVHLAPVRLYAHGVAARGSGTSSASVLANAARWRRRPYAVREAVRAVGCAPRCRQAAGWSCTGRRGPRRR